MKKMKKMSVTNLLMGFVFLTFAASTVYACVRVILAPWSVSAPESSVMVKSAYAPMLFQGVMGVLGILLPGFMRRKARINIPSVILLMYAGVLYCGVFLGEVLNFYATVPHWDTALHTFCGAGLTMLGFSIVSLQRKTDNDAVSFSPMFAVLFAFCFAMTLDVVWEIVEFTIDCIFNSNMQRFLQNNGEPFIGQAALMDTMKDLIVGTMGALAMCVIGYIALKRKNGWLKRFEITREDV